MYSRTDRECLGAALTYRLPIPPVPVEPQVSNIVSLDRERAARELRAAVGQDEAELILSSIRRLVAKAERDPVLLALLVRMMDGSRSSEA